MRSAYRSETNRQRSTAGIYSGLLASFLLGWAPILGKFAYQGGVAPLTLAALRTLVAAVFLWLIYLLLWRRRMVLGWKAAFNCMLVGMINGIGSLFYYSGLERLDASRASLLSTLYPVWVVLFLAASGEPMSRLTLSRLATSLVGAVLVTSPWALGGLTDYLGVMLMIASAAINGWYMVMGQWVLADVPARSGTLYILTGMALIVSVARVGSGLPIEPILPNGYIAILALGLTTAFSRLAIFLTLERVGGVQTAIMNLMELAVSLGLAFALLGDRLTSWQWLGAVLLLGGGVLARLDVERGAAPPPSFNPMDT